MGNAPLFDRDAALNRMGGDEELLKEVGRLFLLESEQLLSEVKRAIDSGRHLDLQHAAHTLKGSISNFCGGSAVEIARQLEYFGRDRRMSDAPDAYLQLAEEVRCLRQEIAEYCRG
jgi:two-component system, sensor histidine kinase and response regulator